MPTDAQKKLFTRVHRKALELLADGEWHDWEASIHALLPVVPPNVAYHQAEATRAWAWRREHPGWEGPVPPRRYRAGPQYVDGIIASGARTIVRHVLNNKRYERDATGKKIRLLPEQEIPFEVKSERAKKAARTRSQDPVYQEKVKELGRRRVESGLSKEIARKAAATRKKTGVDKASAKKAAATRKRTGIGKTAAMKAAETRRRNGNASSAAKRAWQTRLARYGAEAVSEQMRRAVGAREDRKKKPE